MKGHEQAVFRFGSFTLVPSERLLLRHREAVPLTGVVLTKLDGTAKGGIAVAINRELGIPIKLAGVGEKLQDLQPFDATAYAQAIFSAPD